jgi:hypothetical protein
MFLLTFITKKMDVSLFFFKSQLIAIDIIFFLVVSHWKRATTHIVDW